MADSAKVVIITSYVENAFDMKAASSDAGYIICTDGGYDFAVSNDIEPDILIGDLDSIKSDVPENIPILQFDPVKDYTDLQLSIEHALSVGASRVEIWGGIGGRLDQTVANIQLLARYSKDFGSLILKDGANEATVLRPGAKNEIDPRGGWYFSLFSLSKETSGVTVKNAAYELDGAILTNDFPLGVSNEFTNEKAAITYESGTLLLVLSKK